MPEWVRELSHMYPLAPPLTLLTLAVLLMGSVLYALHVRRRREAQEWWETIMKKKDQ